MPRLRAREQVDDWAGYYTPTGVFVPLGSQPLVYTAGPGAGKAKGCGDRLARLADVPLAIRVAALNELAGVLDEDDMTTVVALALDPGGYSCRVAGDARPRTRAHRAMPKRNGTDGARGREAGPGLSDATRTSRPT